MKKEIKDGYEITTTDTGHIIKVPVQPEVIPEPQKIDTSSMTLEEKVDLIIKRLGI